MILLTTVRFELTPLSRTQYYPFKGPSKLLECVALDHSAKLPLFVVDNIQKNYSIWS